MSEEVVVPIFPCISLEQTLEFYVALGFEVTHEQHAPYVYGGVRYRNIELHFHGSKTLKPQTESSHTALIMVSAVDDLHQTFVRGVKATFGKGFRTGIPRIGSVNSFKRDRRFNLLDPSGNRLIVVQPFDEGEQPLEQTATGLEKAVRNARTFAYSKDDPRGAAKILDVGLSRHETPSEALYFRALVLRADVALMLDDLELARELVQKLQALSLQESERRLLDDAFTRLDDLEQLLKSR